MKTGRTKFWEEILVVVFIFLFSFGLRFYKLSETPIYPDEITWMVRGKETALAIRTLNFRFFDTAWWNIKEDTEAIALPLTILTGFPQIYLAQDASVLSFNLFKDYLVGRTVVILFTSLFAVGFYLFVKKVFGSKTAFISSFFLTLDPLFMANSKLIMNDIFLIAFMFISLLFYIAVENNIFSVIFSSLGLALAFLTKPSALVLLSVFLLPILFNLKDWKKHLVKSALIVLLSFLFTSVLWPASWHNFFGAIPEYLIRQKSVVGEGINNFFWGKLTENPPFYYYFVQLVIRIPLIVLAGIGYFLVNAFKGKNKQKSISVFNLTIGLFVVAYLVFMSFSAKKLGARYILPVWPFLYIFFGEAVVLLLSKMKGKILKIMFLLLIIGSAVGIFVRYFPYHDLYYNYLVGGSKNARRVDLVGLCTGSKSGVDYVLGCYPQVHQIAAIGCGRSTIPYYYPYPFNYNWQKEKILVVESYYLQLKKDPELLKYFADNPPLKTITRNGVDLAYIWVRDGVAPVCK